MAMITKLIENQDGTEMRVLQRGARHDEPEDRESMFSASWDNLQFWMRARRGARELSWTGPVEYREYHRAGIADFTDQARRCISGLRGRRVAGISSAQNRQAYFS